jgi:hypothetical protein
VWQGSAGDRGPYADQIAISLKIPEARRRNGASLRYRLLTTFTSQSGTGQISRLVEIQRVDFLGARVPHQQRIAFGRESHPGARGENSAAEVLQADDGLKLVV